MREPRKDALYNVDIATEAGTLVALKGADFDTAFSACKAIEASTKDEKLKEMLSQCIEHFGFMGSSGNGYKVYISAYLPRTDTGETQTCPERMRSVGPFERKENLDTWRLIGGDRVCSFCGSLHPDRVIELLKELGIGIIDNSTKSYKFYVHRPDVPNASFGGIKYYRWHDTPEFVDALHDIYLVKGRG